MMDSGNGGTGMIMPVAPTGFAGTGFGNGFGGDGWWILLLFILLGGWNNNGYGAGAGGFGGGGLYPWMNQSNQINDGFRDQMINGNITGIQSAVTSGFGDVQAALCSGFAGVNAGIANAAAQAEISANARQMADMQQNFALQSQLAQCCCDNRAATQDLKYTLANEACATRAANGDNTQKILDKLCQLELDGVKQNAETRYAALEARYNQALAENQALRFDRSQTAQNAFISQGFSNEVDALYNRLNSCPVPTTPVYGRTPIFTCNNQNTGCGCGCGGNAFLN